MQLWWLLRQLMSLHLKFHKNLFFFLNTFSMCKAWQISWQYKHKPANVKLAMQHLATSSHQFQLKQCPAVIKALEQMLSFAVALWGFCVSQSEHNITHKAFCFMPDLTTSPPPALFLYAISFKEEDVTVTALDDNRFWTSEKIFLLRLKRLQKDIFSVSFSMWAMGSCRPSFPCALTKVYTCRKDHINFKC